MRKFYIYLTLAFLTATSLGVSDADAATDATAPVTVDNSKMSAPDLSESASSPIDPTLAFFSALAVCTPGSYTEKNILSQEVGQANLTQRIIGFSDDKSTCNAVLTTPDNRVLTCAFPAYILPQLNDQHFLEGMLEGTTDSPSKNALDADMLWSKFKADSCGLGS